MARVHLIAAVLATTCLLPRAGLSLEAREVFKEGDASVVVIIAKTPRVERLGSGVLLAPTEVLTSCYLIEEATSILVIRSSVERAARVRFLDRARDLCQLHLDDRIPDAKPVATLVASEKLDVGQS